MKRHKKSKRHGNGRYNKSNVDNKIDSEQCKTVLPYLVQQNETLGRYLVASKNLTAGEIIIEECPIVVGPCQESEPICIGCYKTLNPDDQTRCEECGYPLCTVACTGVGSKYGHSQDECQLISRSNYKNGKHQWSTLRYMVTPLRCLLTKQKEPETWNVLMQMESHDEVRKNITKLWDTNQQFVVDKIRNELNLIEYEEDDIHRICGVLEVNAFEVNATGRSSLRALFPNAFLFSHDCVPNTTHSDKEDFKLVVRAAVPILMGSPITVTYTYTLESTLKRRKHLKDTKFFDCVCKRCSDPTELHTYVGALKCPACTNGLVLSTSCLDPTAEWKCNNEKCQGRSVSATSIQILMERLSDDLERIDGNDIHGYELFLTKYSNVLGRNHYLCLSALHSLSQLYGKINGYLINDLTDEMLMRKIEICRQLLKIFEQVEPGLSKQRGVLLYELHAPLMVLINRKLQSNTILKKELRYQLKEVCKCLDESILILSKERETSNEGLMAKAARDALERIKYQQELMHLT